MVDVQKKKLDIKGYPFQNNLNFLEDCKLPIEKMDRDVISELVTDEIEVKDECDSNNSPLLQNTTPENYFWCTLCNSDTLHKSDHQNIRTSTNENCFKGSICDTSIISNEKPPHFSKPDYNSNRTEAGDFLVVHRTKEEFECLTSGYNTYESHLKHQVNIRAKEKNYKCSFCAYSSSRKNSLKEHMATHGIGKTLECIICGYRTIHKNYLTKHIKIHSKEKPYKCSMCNYGTSRKCNLKQHMASHGIGTHLECFICGYKTLRKNTLINHLITHSEKVF